MKVKTPVEGFNGTVAGVSFSDGVGETDDANALSYFRRHGYQVGNEKPKAQEPSPEGNKSPEAEGEKKPAPRRSTAKKAAKKSTARKTAAKPSGK